MEKGGLGKVRGKTLGTALLLLGANVASLQAQTWGGTSTQMYSNPTTGKVGIGTSNPKERLHVASTDHNYIQLERPSTSKENGFKWTNVDAVQFWFFMDDDNNGASPENGKNLQIESAVLPGIETDLLPRIRFPVNNTNIQACMSGGNFGIGPGTPSEVLDLNQTGKPNYISLGRSSSQFESGIVWKENGASKLYLYLDERVNGNDNFQIQSAQVETDANPRLRIPLANKDMYACLSGGKFGIGTDQPQATLDVAGDARISGSIKVKAWSIVPDYVFEKDYKLASLQHVEKYVEEHKHLPEVPSAKEIKEKGLDLAAMNLKLLKKIEELTLYAIQQEKKDRKRDAEIAELKRALSRMQVRE